MDASRTLPTAEQLGRIDLPTLIYVGDQDARLAASREMAAQMPNEGFWRSDVVLPHLIAFLTEAN